MLKIEGRNVGKLIGIKGATIKQLQNDFNVRISISKEDDEDGMRIVELQGDDEDTQNALEAIRKRFIQDDQLMRQGSRQRIHSNERNRGYQRNEYENSYVSSRGGYNQNYESNQRNYGNNRGNNYNQRRENHDFNGASINTFIHRPSRNNFQREREFKDYNAAEVEMKANFQPSLNTYQKSSSNFGYNENKNFNQRQRSGNYSNNYQEKSSENTHDSQSTPIDWDKLNEECDRARKERWAKCPVMIKNFYQEHPKTAEMSDEEVKKFRLENNKISVGKVFEENIEQNQMPKPITKFEYGFEAYPDLLNEIKKAGFEKPSPIQSQMWPILMAGEDCIGIAQTGTGKTLAFLIPALIHTDGQPHERGLTARGGPNVLVLCPTRELAIQIEKEVGKYQFRGIRAVCLYGGNDRKKQIDAVQSGVEIIIATPGRLNDLIASDYIKIESITYLVLDEADRMLDMGFEPQIRKILLDIRDDRQTVMTSATWPLGVRRLASSYMKNPYQVVIGSLDLAATHTVTQKLEIMDEENKYERICKFVQEELTENDKAIIFCGKKDRADSLSCDFVLKGIKCQSIHGNREQSDREQALADIKSGEVNILIATDVASRGIDIEDITFVVNYDFPRNIEEYVHRVGRTGRANKSGISLSFLTRSDWGVAKELIEILKEASQEVPEELQNMADRYEAKKARDVTSGRGRGSFRGSFKNRGH